MKSSTQQIRRTEKNEQDEG